MGNYAFVKEGLVVEWVGGCFWNWGIETVRGRRRRIKQQYCSRRDCRSCRLVSGFKRQSGT